ncbi:rab2a [Anaeramoeba flamelloides]|uniref:Rab2a n=1 Tax=Anaeramoeba flamelloides TaxID=1746091 RepID=A0ABQ8Z9Q6_9EUKA|nr:rab2a [Anaeramoeba flamelloides]
MTYNCQIELSQMSYDHMFKFIIIGESGVGKSCILVQLTDHKFDNTEPTLGISFKSHILDIDGRTINLRIWDTAGQEQYRSITRSYYRDTQGALVVYDITNLHSFESLSYWVKDAKENSNQEIQMILIGNKKDLEHRRKVSKEVAQQFADENGMVYIETSAKTAENIEDAFYSCAEKVYESVKDGKMDSIGIGTSVKPIGKEIQEIEPVKEKSGGCC